MRSSSRYFSTFFFEGLPSERSLSEEPESESEDESLRLLLLFLLLPRRLFLRLSSEDDDESDEDDEEDEEEEEEEEEERRRRFDFFSGSDACWIPLPSADPGADDDDEVSTFLDSGMCEGGGMEVVAEEEACGVEVATGVPVQ